MTGVADLADELEREVRRVADRARTLGLARLAEPAPPWPSRAAAARAAAQALADATARVEAAPLRTLPALADAAVGNQVVVCGMDLVVALRQADAAGAQAAATDALGVLVAVRRAM